MDGPYKKQIKETEATEATKPPGSNNITDWPLGTPTHFGCHRAVATVGMGNEESQRNPSNLMINCGWGGLEQVRWMLAFH